MDKESSATNPLTEANYGNSSATLPYVTDPKTYNKTYTSTPALANSYGDWYLQGSSAFGLSSFGTFSGTYMDMPGYSSGAVETKVAAYCYENTMLKDKQKNGYTTGIVFKAEIAPSKMMQKSLRAMVWKKLLQLVRLVKSSTIPASSTKILKR